MVLPQAGCLTACGSLEAEISEQKINGLPAMPEEQRVILLPLCYHFPAGKSRFRSAAVLLSDPRASEYPRHDIGSPIGRRQEMAITFNVIVGE